MSIKLTKTIEGKKVELDVISLGGKATIRKESYEKAKKDGLTKKQLNDAGFEVEK